ncbi:HEAT repeat domain-containing protein [Pannus brasiliensis CCIBt3594]|uniref:HEAT repeat domain-containing protein n=1 Tax=Pannus brasiliensis CCIBt3594 TaxID=1427578 RepID=A0AAW9QRS6_9CHRO
MIQQLPNTQIAIDTLSKKLNDSIPQIRAKAAEALGKIGAHRVADTLISHLQQENDSDVRLSIIRALGNIGTESAIPALASCLSDANSDIRVNVAEALGKIGNEKAVQYLIQSLTDSDAKVRTTATIALGEIGLEDAIPHIAKVCSDEDDNVRLSAVDALGKIGSRYALN